jgi:hypothetical protein
MGETWESANLGFSRRQAQYKQAFQAVDIPALKRTISDYVATPTQPRLQTITTGLETLERIHKDYATLNTDIMTEIKNRATATNMSSLMSANAGLQNDITALQQQKKDMRVDVESALAREELLRSRTRDVTSHQLFILDRPVRKGMIPYLWVLSVVFVGIGMILFRTVFPVLPVTAFDLSFMFQDVMNNTTIWIALLICALIVILFLSLKVAGVFGK